MSIQWYPGHMTKAVRQMREDLKLVDLLIEVIDARIPVSSRNPDIDEMGKNKYRVVLMNKADLAQESRTKEWLVWFQAQGIYAAAADSRRSKDLKKVRDVIGMACARKKERDKKRGIVNRPVRAMIVGIPNSGKSTFINSFCGKAAAKTGNKPGVTKGKQWIRLDKDIELLDTPGILWPKFEDETVGAHLAMVGSIRDEVLPAQELSLLLIGALEADYPGVIAARYGISREAPGEEDAAAAAGNVGASLWQTRPDGADAGEIADGAGVAQASMEWPAGNAQAEEAKAETRYPDAGLSPAVQDPRVRVLTQIAVRRGAMRPDGTPDYERASHILLQDFRSGKLGRITLEKPPAEGNPGR